MKKPSISALGSRLAAVLTGVLLAASASAKIVENGLGGNVAFDGWDVLGGIAGYGFGSSWVTPLGSFEAGSADATLDRVNGSHYSATGGLYSFSGSTEFVVGDATALASVETVVFSINTTLGADDLGLLSNPVLNYNGGTQSVLADYDFTTALSQVNSPFGLVDAFVHTFQWDVSGLGVSAFDVVWDQQLHASVLSLQLEQSDSFSIANAQVVPVPAAGWLFASAGLALSLLRRRG